MSKELYSRKKNILLTLMVSVLKQLGMPQETNTGTALYKLNRADPCEGLQPLTLAMDCVGRVGVWFQP